MLFLHQKYRKRIYFYEIYLYQNLHALFYYGLSDDICSEDIAVFGIPSLIDDLIEKGLFNKTVGKFILKDAVSSNRFEIIKKLESLGIEKEFETPNINTINEPTIFTAIQNNSLDFVKSYINSGASLEITDKHCRTPLYLVVLENRVEIAQELIYNGADVNCKDDSYTRLIELAVKKNELNLVSMLLNAGAKANPSDLYYALENNFEIAKLMIQNGVDINGEISGYETALTHAIRRNNMTLFNALIRMKVDPDVPDNNGAIPETPIFIAIERNSKEMVQILIQSGANIEARCYGDDTPLICAAAHGCDEILSILIEAGADLEAVDNRGNTALIKAIRSHQIGCTYIFIKAGANLEARSNIGFTPLMHAVEYINENSPETENIINEIISYLISAGANIHAKCRGVTAFMIAAMRGNQDACYLLLEAGANINERDDQGETALILIADYKKNHKMIKCLIKLGLNVNEQDNEGMTALMYASFYNRYDNARVLLLNHADTEIRDKNGRTAIMHAITNKATKTFDLLLLAGARTDVVDQSGKSLLVLDAEHGYMHTLACLARQGLNPGVVDENGRTLLMIAAQKGLSADAVVALINAGVNIEAKDNFGKTALMYAAEYGGNVQNLIESGANIEARDIYGQTALMWAAKCNKYRLIKTLIDNGSNIDDEDNEGKTAYLLAVENRHTQAASTLLDLGATFSQASVRTFLSSDSEEEIPASFSIDYDNEEEEEEESNDAEFENLIGRIESIRNSYHQEPNPNEQVIINIADSNSESSENYL